MSSRNVFFVTAAVIAAVLLSAAQDAKKSGAWEPFRYFEGNWKGTAAGEPGQGTVERSYRFILNGKFMEGRNASVYPPQEKNKSGEKHQDLGIYSYDKARKKFVLRQFHVEGFVNTYVQKETGDPKRIVFESEAIENIPPGWRARETWTIVSQDEFTEKFELAEPGKEFAVYSESKLRRVK